MSQELRVCIAYVEGESSTTKDPRKQALGRSSENTDLHSGFSQKSTFHIVKHLSSKHPTIIVAVTQKQTRIHEKYENLVKFRLANTLAMNLINIMCSVCSSGGFFKTTRSLKGNGHWVLSFSYKTSVIHLGPSGYDAIMSIIYEMSDYFLYRIF
ncbi:hypothetical protein ACRRTK_022078 [Alexandromys fortis]